jgi:hypothetical protein
VGYHLPSLRDCGRVWRSGFSAESRHLKSASSVCGALPRRRYVAVQKIIQNSLSTFGAGGDELLVSKTTHFTVFRGFSFVFDAFAVPAGVVAAAKTTSSAVKISQRTPEKFRRCPQELR